MTTEDLIELLRQHPKEQVGVAVTVGDQQALCGIVSVRRCGASQPRLRLFVEVELRLDESRSYDVVRECVLVKGDHGGSHE